jgi:putative Ca2+/H+ antiporter (TMEM165/GDT1 family)
MMLVIAVALFFGVRFPKIFWQLVLAGTALAVIFCHWLAFQTTFIIGALCPYCMVAWFATLLVLSVAFRELIQFKRDSLTDESSIEATETIQKWMVPFHLLWAALLIGSAFLGV